MTAGIVDVCSLVLTSAFFIGVILGTALIVQKCQALIDATKASLEERGLIVHGAARSSSASREGEGAKGGGAPGNVVVVKTGKKKMDQERYLDRTQRGVMKALNASTFGPPSSQSQATGGAGGGTVEPSSPLPWSSSSSHRGVISSTFTHFRSQLSLAPAPAATPASPPQSGKLRAEFTDSGQVGASRSSGSGRGVSGVTSVTSDGDLPGSGATGTTGTRDSHNMAGRLSAWPTEKVEKVKHLRDQFLSKV